MPWLLSGSAGEPTDQRAVELSELGLLLLLFFGWAVFLRKAMRSLGWLARGLSDGGLV